jgi:Holliday junction resolvase-like predicted endonuclease
MERNVRTPNGEIDLVARQEYASSTVIVMVEVKRAAQQNTATLKKRSPTARKST